MIIEGGEKNQKVTLANRRKTHLLFRKENNSK